MTDASSSDTTQAAKAKAAEAKDAATEAAHTASAKAREAAHDLKAQATRVAQDAAETARDEAYARGETVKHSAADEIGNVGSALRKAANDMRSGSPQERTIGYLATTLADASDSIREKDLAEMVDDVTGFARRNPLLFVTGAALLGFAASRFGKASHVPSYDDPAQSTQFPDQARARATATTAPTSAKSTAPGTPYPAAPRSASGNGVS